MGDWPEGRVPCAENPERWELLTQLHTDADIAAACLMAGQAIHICRSCPGLAACARAAAADPPVRHVQAGVIYDRAGRRCTCSSGVTCYRNGYRWRDGRRHRCDHR